MTLLLETLIDLDNRLSYFLSASFDGLRATYPNVCKFHVKEKDHEGRTHAILTSSTNTAAIYAFEDTNGYIETRQYKGEIKRIQEFFDYWKINEEKCSGEITQPKGNTEIKFNNNGPTLIFERPGTPIRPQSAKTPRKIENKNNPPPGNLKRSKSSITSQY